MKFKEMLTSSAQKFTQYYKDHKKRTIAIGSGVLVIIILLVTILGEEINSKSSATQILTLSPGIFEDYRYCGKCQGGAFRCHHVGNKRYRWRCLLQCR
jgi:hypothetical protein